MDSTGDQYIQERLALLQALALSPDDIERIREAQRQVEQPEAEVDTELGEDDSGIIDYVPPSAEVMEIYKTYTKVLHIERSYSLSFHDWILQADEHTGIGDKLTSNTVPQLIEHYSIRDEDQAFGRFVKSCCKKMLNEEFAELVDPADYFNRTQVFFEIFDKFTTWLKKEGDGEQQKTLFSAKYVADIKTKMLLYLSDKYHDDKQYDEYTTLAFLTIIMNHMLSLEDNDSRDINECNRKLLGALRRNDEFRELGYIRYVIRVTSMLELKGLPVNLYPEIQYIDGLFGYKPLKAVKDSILSDYGQNAVITLKDGTLYVDAKVKSLGEYMIMREGSLRDINNYVKNLGSIKELVVDIEPAVFRRGPDPATKITYCATTLPANSVKQVITRKSGKKEPNSIKVI